MEPRADSLESLWARSALLPEGWVENLRIEMRTGRITALSVGTRKSARV